MLKIKEQIFEDLYELENGLFLSWNKLFRGWEISPNCWFDILSWEENIISRDQFYPKTLKWIQ